MKPPQEKEQDMTNEKFTSPFPPPEGLTRELLVILSEEANEVGQRVCKALRFGLEEIQPGQPLTNAERIMQEVGDFMAVVGMLIENGNLTDENVGEHVINKRRKLEKYLQN